ncbi:MAG TPA: tyrosine-type recombinase/integrase, partial [Polyangiaceae bacterium]|nr:tyrosine-type recombinase/integrase [Polyangiaceae bacterium]
KLTKGSPLPDGWAESGGERAEFQMLYPDEEARLMRCPELSLEQKYLWGVLAREGFTLQEAYDLTWGEVDLLRGTIRVVRSKTGRPRRWRMGDDVWRALAAKKPEAAGTSDKVFAPDVARKQAAEAFRLDLRNCGITRSELHEGTATRRRIRAHDLRGTFVALALARGKSDQWIMDRTGHSQSQMLRVYDRDSRFAAQQELGWFEDLDVLLGVARGVAIEPEKELVFPWLRKSSVDFSGEDTLPSQPETAAERQPHDAEEAARHPGAMGGQKSWPSGEDPTAAPKTKGAEASEAVVGASLGRPNPAGHAASAPADIVEHALALALEAAVAAGRLDLVPGIVAELGERRRARTAQPGVVSLDTRRKRNGDQ